MKRWMLSLLSFAMIVVIAGCGGGGTGGTGPSTIDRIQENKKLVVGTAPGYLPFDMKNKDGEFVGYDMDVAKKMGEALGVEVEFKQYEFSGLIPALQTGDIDMILAGMTIRGDRALSVSFSDPYYATGQMLMLPKGDTSTKSWQDLDKKGNTIAVSQGTTGALLAKSLFKNATIKDWPDFPSAGMALMQGDADGIIYDEPALKVYANMYPDDVRMIDELISKENLGIAVQKNDTATVQWINSFLASYVNSLDEKKSREKWFESSDWMEQVEEKVE